MARPKVRPKKPRGPDPTAPPVTASAPALAAGSAPRAASAAPPTPSRVLPSRLHQVLGDAGRHLRAGGVAQAVGYLRQRAAQPSPPGQPSPPLAERLTLLAALVQTTDPNSALALAEAAIAEAPEHWEAWVLAGAMQDRLGRREAAMDATRRVVTAAGASPDQVLRSANLLVRFGEQDLALERATAAYDQLGAPLRWASALLYIAQVTADWPLVDRLTAQLRAAYATGRWDEAAESPRTHILWCDDEATNLEVIKRWSLRTIAIPPGLEPPPARPLAGRKLRVGYLSSDFRDHPTSRLINGLLRHHDRARFELFMYCSGWDDGSSLRREVDAHFDHIHSVAGLDDLAAAALIRDHGIDVLVELNGPTRAHRMGILAQRPAPVQIDYLGWPGSVGGRVVDYVVGDEHTVPPAAGALYPERVIRLSKTYQINDFASRVRPPKPRRQEVGLPAGGWLVLGMFNAINKVHGAVWDAWLRILQAVPHTLLWLLDPGPVARRHIAAATQARGIAVNRILVAPRLPQEAHLARLQCCDLMLDPWPYGGHTSTSDALFAGVPVVTLAGRNFAGRVSGGLLQAAGLEILVQPDVDTYVSFTIDLLRSPDKLAKAQRFVRERVPRSHLFDARTKTREMEAAYLEAYQRRASAQAPTPVTAGGSEAWIAPSATRQAPPPADTGRLPLVLVCGPRSSGTSAVAGMLAKAGLFAPGPYVQVNDPRTPETYEMHAFRALLWTLAQERPPRRTADREAALAALRRFRDQELAPLCQAAGLGEDQPLLLKHPLTAFLLPELAELFALKIVVVHRDLEEIEATRARRNWGPEMGAAGAEIIYCQLSDFARRGQAPVCPVRYQDLLADAGRVLDRLGHFLGLEWTADHRRAALAFVARPAKARAVPDEPPPLALAALSPQGPEEDIVNQAKELHLEVLKQAVAVDEKAVAVFAVSGNERYFLPHFLGYYRGLGVRHFVFLDDHSSDGSRELLLQQNDCTVLAANFRFGEPFMGQRFGVKAKQVIPQRHLMGRWVLTVDVDELLLLPPPFSDLAAFCAHLDTAGRNHARAIMLDFFPERLADLVSAPVTTDPFVLCPYFDALSKVDWPEGQLAPRALSLGEGVRARLLRKLLDREPAINSQLAGYRLANLNKVPLVRWDAPHRVLSPHRIDLPIASDHQLVLAHFKFFPGWKEKIEEALARVSHWNASIEYRMLRLAYRSLSDWRLPGPRSQPYRGPQQMAELGLLYHANRGPLAPDQPANADPPNAMGTPPLISFITTCKNRLHHLRQSLPAMARQSHAEVIVVDYGCPQGTAAWVRQHYPGVVVSEVRDDPGFNVSRARNLGALQARGAWLCFIDADMVLQGDLGSWVAGSSQAGHYYLAKPMRKGKGLFGTVLCRKTDHLRVGGYDEAFVFWGGEDEDLYRALREAGISEAGFPLAFLAPILHGDADRSLGRQGQPSSKRQTLRIHQLYSVIKSDLKHLGGQPLPLAARKQLMHELLAQTQRFEETGDAEAGKVVIQYNQGLDSYQSANVERCLVYRFRHPRHLYKSRRDQFISSSDQV